MYQSKEQEQVGLANIARGAAIERFDKAWEELILNCLDMNTKPNEIRSVTLTVKVKPSETRDAGVITGRVEIAVAKKLANYKAVETTVYMGTTQGEPVAVEHNPKQMTFDTVVAGAETDTKGVQ